MLLDELSVLVQGTQSQTQSNIVAASGLTTDIKAPQSTHKPRIVILGSGWGAMSFIKNLSKKDRYNSLCSTSNVAAHCAPCGPNADDNNDDSCQCRAASRRPVCNTAPAHLADVLFAFCSQKYDITLVSPRNYFLYTPLLPAVATGTVEERSIVEPIRRIMAGKVTS